MPTQRQRSTYRSDNLTIVLVGPAGKIGEDVRKYDQNRVIVPIKAPGWGGNKIIPEPQRENTIPECLSSLMFPRKR